jgi:hypothetical protein
METALVVPGRRRAEMAEQLNNRYVIERLLGRGGMGGAWEYSR